jgi:putative membrane protein
VFGAHPLPEGSADLVVWEQRLVPALLLPATAAYLAGVVRLRRRGDSWPWTRIGAAGFGLACLIAVLLPPLAAGTTFPEHAVRHLLLALAAPLGFALSAPITLALRTFPHRPRRVVLIALHSRFARALMSAPVVLILDVGAMYALYLTPLYAAMHRHPWLNAALLVHFFLAGCLLSWYLVGSDPMPRRASIRTRIVVLFLTAGSHALLAKLLYAQLLPEHGGSPEQLRLGAQIMFYGGDLVELALAVALLSGWYARGGRRLRHEQRRQALVATGRRH